MKKQIIFGFFLILVIVNMFGIVRSEMLISSANVSYDSTIIDEFNRIKGGGENETFVQLLVYLKNGSEAEDIISNFNGSEISKFLHRENSDTIVVKMTEEGFYKLIQDNRVDKVYYDFPIHAFLNENVSLNQIYLVIFIALLILCGIILYIIRKKHKK
jgi:hypothetical protein